MENAVDSALFVMLQCVLLVFLCVVCTVTDLRSRKIKNCIVFFVVLCGLIMHTCAYGFYGLGQAVAGCLLPLVLFPLFYWGYFGAGDIKLFMASGACLGFSLGLSTVLWTFLAEGMIGFLALSWHRGVCKKTSRLQFPMAPFHAAGVLLACFGTHSWFG